MRVRVPVLQTNDFRIPAQYSRLADLAHNLWWSWDRSAYSLWRQLDPVLWERYRNPVEVLAAMDEASWESLLESDLFQDLYTDTARRFDAYLDADSDWFDATYEDVLPNPVAYLCAEFGVHVSMPMYSGGLGVLAGDHAKSASDLGVPFVGTGLLYRRGYFRQHLDVDGTQQHYYPILDMSRLPVRRVAAPSGGQLRVRVEFPGRTVEVAVWCMEVGRVPILLLDTDIPSNDPADRPITHTLYVRGREMRFCQELVLGVGAVRALAALGIEPSVWHVNEGHAAMSILERLSRSVAGGASLDQASERITAKTVFTLHTPVPAGNETFDTALVEKYLSWWPSRVGTDLAHLNHLGSSGREGDTQFDLGALAIRHASVVNGVSQKHAEIVNRDWVHLLRDSAIGVTNGVHPSTWIGRDVSRSLEKALGNEWERRLIDDRSAAALISEMHEEEVWTRHLDRKEILSRFVRSRTRMQMARHGSSPDELRSVERLLPTDRLTIGFARRFATYKRATLLFHNVPWLQSILTDPDRPVQILFAGKAHPADRHGQALIQNIVELSKTQELSGHIHVLEDYDTRMARFLVQGVDVWLNNPRPPQEASGTSGMKAAMNGALNLSVADGWWIEGFNGKNGWVFGADTENPDYHAQDNEDAVQLYQLLQDVIAPLYYDRNEAGVPSGWVRMMQEAMISTIAEFSTHRMVQEYVTRAYVPVGR
jgi:starch phosphorylase